MKKVKRIERLPADWSERCRHVIEVYAGNCCQPCGVLNGIKHPEEGILVVLTVSLINADKKNKYSEQNMFVGCQACQLKSINYADSLKVKERKGDKMQFKLF